MKPNILFIEDHLDNTMPARRIFSQDSYNLMNVGTGIQRVFLVENSDVDVVQPVIDGYDVPHRLRAGKKELLINTPIIAVAAHAMKGDAKRLSTHAMMYACPGPLTFRSFWRQKNPLSIRKHEELDHDT